MINLLFSLKGRISRAKMGLVFILASLALTWPLDVVLADMEGALIGADPRITALSPVTSIALGIWTIFVFYIAVAVVVKRLHDRGKSAVWLLLFFGIPLSFFATAYCAVGWPPRSVDPAVSISMGVFFVVVLVNNVWYLVEVLLLPGTNGDNRFGPDPRGVTTKAG